MAVNWNNPTLTSLYTAVLQDLKDRDLENLLMNSVGDANLPVGAIRWAPGGVNALQYWTGVGTGWANLILSAAGGGTGTASGVPALGTMASQNANAVAITGGTITGINFNANVITSGTLPLNRGGTGASLALGTPGSFLMSSGLGTGVVFDIAGGLLTNLNASNLGFGNIPVARMPTSGIWNLSAFLEIISSGPVRVASSTGFAVGNIAPMGNGTVNALAYYIDGVPFVPGSGVPTGMMAAFSGGCPAGWTNMNIDGRTIRYTSSGAGATGGADDHQHQVQGNTQQSDRPFTENTAMAGVNRSFDSGASFSGFLPNDNFTHHHDISLHAHFLDFLSQLSSSWPKYIDFVLCRKD